MSMPKGSYEQEKDWQAEAESNACIDEAWD
jgi:hypothetical protein